MANCITCNKETLCSCTLIGGRCVACYTTFRNEQEPANPDYFPFNVESATITEVAQSRGISTQEQLRRINEILLKAREKIIEDVDV